MGRTTQLPYTEDSALQPVFPYDVSKAATDLIARSYWHTYGLPVAVTRFANLYGGGDRNFSRLIPETVTAVLDGRRPIIRSDGSPERDFLYVEDAARAYLAVAEALASGEAGGEAFNAGWGRPHPVREVVDLICELGPGDVEPDYQGSRQPERRDRPPVPRLDQDPRADRLAAEGRPARGPQPDARVVRRAPGGAGPRCERADRGRSAADPGRLERELDRSPGGPERQQDSAPPCRRARGSPSFCEDGPRPRAAPAAQPGRHAPST